VLGCWANERWRTELALAAQSRLLGVSWRDLHNRNERLLPGSSPEARICPWQDSSLLTVARVFPRVGGRILERAARDWPFAFASEAPRPSEEPAVSVIVPVGGLDRRGQFELVLASLSAQSLRDLEIIVVEQAKEALYRELCPAGVRYAHLDVEPGRAFNKSRGLNAGARIARGRVLVVHDADLVVPVDYLTSIIEKTEQGYEGVQPLRFIFYLDREQSEGLRPHTVALPATVQSIGYNNPGSSTVATREAYWAIGGHDERFEERGADDNDFRDRLKTLRFFEGGYAPALHLWHPTDPTSDNSPTMMALKQAQLGKPPEQRIAELVSRLY
jgi:hypothetical protein